MPLPAFLAAAMASPVVGSALSGIANAIGGNRGANKQYHANKKLAAFQHAKNMELLKYQLDYNSPASQMGRFKDAGLNPNLIYGQGSPGNMDTPPRYPDIKTADFQTPMSNLGTGFMQTTLAQAQADLVNQKVNESGIKQDLMRAQTNLTNANPHLNKQYVDAMVLNLESVAKLKEQEANFMTTTDHYKGINTHGYQKMQLEIETLSQRFNLNQADQKIKAQIIESKDFQNAILKIQKDWISNGDITPQHIYQGIMMLLSKMM